MIDDLYKVAREAGSIILKYYGNKEFSLKEDLSPLTQADQESHNFLVTKLKKIRNIPILSEEKIISYEERKNWEQFWLIDPLDGTKEFIHGINEFCICIALIKEKKPVVGSIYAPALNEFYFAEERKGFHYKGPKQPPRIQKEATAGISRFHTSKETQHYLKEHSIKNVITMGAAIKFGRMALGEIDIYPRFERSKEWDIGAGHIIIKEAGGNIFEVNSQKEPLYNKPSIENEFFIAKIS